VAGLGPLGSALSFCTCAFCTYCKFVLGLEFFVHFLSVVVSFIVSTSVVACLERLVSKMTHHVSSGMLHPSITCLLYLFTDTVFNTSVC